MAQMERQGGFIELSDNRAAKRHKGKLHEFDVLTGKRNANDRNKKKRCKYEVYKSGVQPAT